MSFFSKSKFIINIFLFLQFNPNKIEKNQGKKKNTLSLEILNSWSLPKGLQLHINEYGWS